MSISTPNSIPPIPESVVRGTELLLAVFIHGFKGTDTSFEEFPQRLQHLLSESVQPMQVECVVFPAYETKGELDKAVIRFSDWLTTLTVQREVACGTGAGSVKVVLCGHSMGGLLAADTLRAFVQSRPDKTAPLWPKIVALIAFDTPFFGIHPHVVKNSFTKAGEYANAATTVGSAILGSFAAFGATKKVAETPPATPAQKTGGGWGSWAGPAFAIGGALVAGAVAGGAYYNRDNLSQGFTWATDHMKFVGSLWDEPGLQQRMDDLLQYDKELGIVFRTFYAFLPPQPPNHLTSRTFVVLPKYTSPAKALFTPAANSLAPDEIQAHRGMFSPTANDGYYQLGLAAARIIRDSVVTTRPKSPISRAQSPVARPRTPQRRMTNGSISQ